MRNGEETEGSQGSSDSTSLDEVPSRVFSEGWKQLIGQSFPLEDAVCSPWWWKLRAWTKEHTELISAVLSDGEMPIGTRLLIRFLSSNFEETKAIEIYRKYKDTILGMPAKNFQVRCMSFECWHGEGLVPLTQEYP